MVADNRPLAPGGPPPERRLPGGVVCLPAGDVAHLLPARPEIPACYHLLRSCRRLAAAAADRRLPATQELAWVDVPGAGLLPLPRLPAPRGEPLDVWLQGGEATAPALLAVVQAAIELTDALAAAGYLPQAPALAGVWVDQGTLSWLPAALQWPSRGAWPSAQSLQAGTRAGAEFVHNLLQAARTVSGIDMVWDELWALCYRVLEAGYGLTPATFRSDLEALRQRCLGHAYTPHAQPETRVLVDAGSLQTWLGNRSLDLVGLLRSLLGPSARVRGVVAGPQRLSAAWQWQAQQAGLEWAPVAQLDLRQAADELRSLSEPPTVLLVCAGADAVAEQLPYLRVQRGLLATLAPVPESVPIPQPWELAGVRQPLHQWCRLGQAGPTRFGGAGR